MAESLLSSLYERESRVSQDLKKRDEGRFAEY